MDEYSLVKEKGFATASKSSMTVKQDIKTKNDCMLTYTNISIL